MNEQLTKVQWYHKWADRPSIRGNGLLIPLCRGMAHGERKLREVLTHFGVDTHTTMYGTH